ncbi:MAG: hypothetical protein GC200_02045 [Tepidisphaera sp.]|nr:hypothetical protein [Tepidisphaera sp.]
MLCGCSTAPQSDLSRQELKDEAAAAVKQAEKTDTTMDKALSEAKGYAVFPTVGKGAIGIGGAYGRGVLYEGGSITGYCDLSQATIGLQLGGQAYTEIICFQDDVALQTFKTGNFAFAAEATAVALKSGAGANAKYANGIKVFTFGESGLMYEASIGGQKFSFLPAK